MTQPNTPDPTARRALRMREFCRSYSISRTQAYRLMESGQLQTVKVGGARLVPVDAAEALLKARAA